MLKPPSSASVEEFSTRELLASTNRRMQKVVLVSSLSAMAACLALFAAMPLKRTIPYVIEVNKTTGEVSAPVQQTADQYTPTWASESFFVRRWITDLLTINNYTFVSVNDPRAQAFLRGATAIAEFKTFRAHDQTYDQLAKDPAMVRTVKIDDFTAVAGAKNAAVANVELTTIRGGQTTVTHELMTVYWTILPPQDPQDIQHNPIGIYVTDFKLSGA